VRTAKAVSSCRAPRLWGRSFLAAVPFCPREALSRAFSSPHSPATPTLPPHNSDQPGVFKIHLVVWKFKTKGAYDVSFTVEIAGKPARRWGRGGAGIAGFLACSFAFATWSTAQNTAPSSVAPAPAGNVQVPSTSGPQDAAAPQADESGRFVFKKQIEEVVLHATVVDDQNHLITGLARDKFEVYEDGKLQQVTSFRTERVPVALGILIDNSGSMLPKRAKVNDAALRLVDASQQQDQVFVVNFAEDAFLDQDYTQDVSKLRAALQHVETRGSTALYDAVVGAVDHLNQTSQLQKKVLLVVTDGRDNASQATFQEALRKLQSKNGPVLYTIALGQYDRPDNDRRGEDRRDNDNRQSLRTLSEQTGGSAFFPSNLNEVESIASAIAQDIRSQYVIGYRSSNPHTSGTYHSIQVHALDGATRLRVQTRTGYYSGSEGSGGSH
jgi:Ca-activated chloride channel homolog